MSAALHAAWLKRSRATSLGSGSTLNACSAAKQWAGRSQRVGERAPPLALLPPPPPHLRVFDRLPLSKSVLQDQRGRTRQKKQHISHTCYVMLQEARATR